MQRGFTLVEILVSTAIAVTIGLALAVFVHAVAGWGVRTAAATNAQAALDGLTERWYAQSATAWSVFTPATDVLKTSNADGHEFDIATVDSQRRPLFRAYRYDAAAHTLTEYAYASPGSAPITGNAVANVSAFEAHTYPASALADAASPAYDPLFAGAHVENADVAVGLGPEALGGNRITRIRIASEREDRTVVLSSETAPSSFTVVLTYTPAP